MIDILIPNYNGKHLLAACLDSILPQLKREDRITIIDNGSSDGSVEFLRECYPRVHLLVNVTNLGFSAAINAGIVATEQPLVFLLNNDTELAPDCLACIREDVKQAPEYDFFALKMLDFKHRSVLDGAGDGYFRGGMGYRLGTMEKDGPTFAKPAPVFGACAGAAVYRRSFFARVGLFDEDFFAYLEDVDINLRANRRGMRCLFIPRPRVYHLGSATSGSTFNPLTIKLTTRNSFRVLIKNYPLSFFVSQLPAIAIYHLFWFLFVIRKRQLKPYFSGISDFLKNIRRTVGKRRASLRDAVLSKSEFALVLVQAEHEVVRSIMRRRQALGKGNLLLELYRLIFLRAACKDG